MRPSYVLIAAAIAVLPSAAARADEPPRLAAAKAKAAANDDDEDEGTSYSGKHIIRHKGNDEIDAESSEANREGKRGSAVFEAIGFAPLVGAGVAVGAYLNPDLLFEASYHHGSEDAGFVSLESEFVEARAKIWYGNSFYLNAGAAYQQAKGSAGLAALTGGGTVDATVNAWSIGPAVAIGNRWQWESFSLGCDWIGFYLPVYKSAPKVSTASGISGSDSETQDAKNQTSTLAAESAMALRFYLGASF